MLIDSLGLFDISKLSGKRSFTFVFLSFLFYILLTKRKKVGNTIGIWSLILGMKTVLMERPSVFLRNFTWVPIMICPAISRLHCAIGKRNRIRAEAIRNL